MASSERDVTPIARTERSGENYSRRVRRLKIALPVIAAVTIALIFFGPKEKISENLGLSPEDRAALGDGLRLITPRYTGTTEDDEPYVLRAVWALPDGPNPKKIELGELEGEISLTDGRNVTLTAAEGLYRPRTRKLNLAGGVAIDSSDGYSIRTEAAILNGTKDTVVTKTPIEAWGPKGRLEAGSMRAERDENGDDIVWFDGGVRVVFRPDATDEAAPGGETGSEGASEGKRQP